MISATPQEREDWATVLNSSLVKGAIFGEPIRVKCYTPVEPLEQAELAARWLSVTGKAITADQVFSALWPIGERENFERPPAECHISTEMDDNLLHVNVKTGGKTFRWPERTIEPPPDPSGHAQLMPPTAPHAPLCAEPEPQPMATVLDEIESLILKYVTLPDQNLATLIAAWIANTYTYERFQYCGYLALRSSTPRCGKSRLLRLVAMLAKGTPPITMNPTGPCLFRSTRPVLILDEVDALRNKDKEKFADVLAVLNSGFEKGAVVERLVPTKAGGYAMQSFPVYGPKALAGIEALADTLADRAFMIQMQRTPDRMPRFNGRLLADSFQRIREGLEAWADSHAADLVLAYEQLPDELPELAGFDDRLQDIAEPLVILASQADAERTEGPKVLLRLLAGLHAAAGRREPSNRERQLLAILDIFKDYLNDSEAAFIASSELVERCQDREELSRIETGRALAGLLKHFDLKPGFNTEKTARGYTITAEWVSEWSGRYRG